MEPRERVLAVLRHEEPDRVPLFEVWINDDVVAELGYQDLQGAHVGLGLDCIMIPTQIPTTSNYWRNGLDEFGQVWKGGIYAEGVIGSEADLDHYTPNLGYVEEFFPTDKISRAKRRYPDHCFIYGSHIGPLTMGYMVMGFESFFKALIGRPTFVERLLQARTNWCIAMCQKATSVGVDVIVLGDDAGQRDAPMISAEMWRKYILPYHRRIVEEVKAPIIWHSDGAIESLLPMAIEAGFVGVHGLEPAAGINLRRVKQRFGSELVLVGNVDVRVLCGRDLDVVRADVSRCMEEGADGGGYMFSSCNSLFKGMYPASIVEMYRYATEIGPR